MNDKERILDLERRLKELEEKVAKLMPWGKLGPKPNEPIDWPDDWGPFEKLPNPIKWPPKDPIIYKEPECPVCNIEYKNMTHFCCGNQNCPNRITCSH